MSLGWSPTAIGLMAGAAWFAVFVASHVAGLRRGHHGAGYFVRSYAAAGLGLIFTLCALGFRSGSAPALVLSLTHGCLSYACLFVLYVPFFYSLTTSLSVETLISLLQRGGQTEERVLYRRFASLDFAQDRVDTLHRSGYLSLGNGSYRPTGRGRAAAGLFAAIKSLWRLGPGG